MNKQELIAAVAAETSMPKKCVETVLKSIVDNVVAEVAKKGNKAFKEAVNAKPAKKGKK